MKLKVSLLLDSIFYRQDDPQRMMAQCAAMLRTALRGALTLLVVVVRPGKVSNLALLDTDVQHGVPPIVRESTAWHSGMILRCLDHDRAVIETGFPDGTFYDWSAAK